MLACLAVAMVGTQPFLNPGCGAIKVKDTVSGELRDATPEEVEEMTYRMGEVGKTVTIATGQVQYLPFVDIGVRLVALILAFYQRTAIKKKEVPTPAT